VSGPEEGFGPPDERLREALERELGEVPRESPSEPPPEVPAEGESDKRESEECESRDEVEDGE
jgi:hypothetical protein